jgi:hypothetical protein
LQLVIQTMKRLCLVFSTLSSGRAYRFHKKAEPGGLETMNSNIPNALV